MPQNKEDFTRFLELGRNKFKEIWNWAPKHYSQQVCHSDCPCIYGVDIITFETEESICILPEEIILKIFDLVDDDEQVYTMAQAAQASKQFHRIAYTEKHALFRNRSKSKCADTWLDPVTDKVKLALLSNLCQTVSEWCDVYVHPYHTCYSENFNYTRAMLTRKGKSYFFFFFTE